MKKIFFAVSFLLLIASLCFGQLKPSTAPNFNFNSNQALREIAGLPAIRVVWFYVDPYYGDSTAYGYTVTSAVKHIDSAYAHCVDGRGDGIVLFSHDSAGVSKYTTSYVRKTLRWAKSSITVVGISSGNGIFGRARIAGQEESSTGVAIFTMTAHTIVRTSGSFKTDGWLAGMTGYCASSGTSSANNALTFTLTTVTATTLTFTETFSVQTAAQAGTVTLTSYCSPVIVVSGENNSFYNVHVYNGGTLTADTGGVSVQGDRNYFSNCHFVGSGNATAAALATYQFDLELSANECKFDDCFFGTNNTIHAAANAPIKLGKGTGQINQAFFNRCSIISYSATAGRGAINITNAVTLGGWVQFNSCTFVNWNSGAITALTKAVIGATPNNTGILFNNCGMVGWAAWGTGALFVTTNAAGASGTGGIGGHL